MSLRIFLSSYYYYYLLDKICRMLGNKLSNCFFLRYRISSMEKRIHSKKTSDLTYRHYLFHFKWSLMGFLILSSFILFTEINLTSIILPYINEEQQQQQIEFSDKNVIYPLDISKNNYKINRNINYYFKKKDQLKLIDDKDAEKKNYKIVLPLIKSKIQSKSYLILEYTKVFSKPKFCSSTNEEIFGKFCPYKNW